MKEDSFDIVEKPLDKMHPIVEAILNTVESKKAIRFSLHGISVSRWRNKLITIAKQRGLKVHVHLRKKENPDNPHLIAWMEKPKGE